jgi:hypothetical protein
VLSGVKTGHGLGTLINTDMYHNVPNGLILNNMAAVSGIIIVKL